MTPLITYDHRTQLLDNGAAAARGEKRDPLPVVKLFTMDAHATWLLTELDPADGDTAFGLIDLGMGTPELGHVRLSVLEGIRGPRNLALLAICISRQGGDCLNTPGWLGLTDRSTTDRSPMARRRRAIPWNSKTVRIASSWVWVQTFFVWIATQYSNGATLSQIVRMHGPLSATLSNVSFHPIGGFAMADSSAIHWHPSAAYLYVLHLDGPALAWEYLRRNPEYRRAWQCHRRHPQHEAHRWGLRLLEDPTRDARDAYPDWFPDPSSVVQAYPDADPTADALLFQLWRFPGRKHLMHDGRRLVLTTQLVNRMLRMAISPALEDSMAYVYAVRAGCQLRERWRSIEVELTLLDAAKVHRIAIATSRPGRTAMLHMRTLQALDGTLAGASQRGVAEVLFGIAAVTERWYDDGDLRAQVRRLIRRGQTLTGGGYRRLLQLGRSAQGR